MADPRFFYNSGPISLNQIKKLTGVEIRGREGPDREFTDVQPLKNAGPDHVSFLNNNAYREALRSSEAGACILRSEEAHLAPSGMIVLVTPQPYHVYAKLAAEFYHLSQIMSIVIKYLLPFNSPFNIINILYIKMTII